MYAMRFEHFAKRGSSSALVSIFCLQKRAEALRHNLAFGFCTNPKWDRNLAWNVWVHDFVGAHVNAHPRISYVIGGSVLPAAMDDKQWSSGVGALWRTGGFKIYYCDERGEEILQTEVDAGIRTVNVPQYSVCTTFEPNYP